MVTGPIKFLVCVDDTDHAKVAVRFAVSKASKLNAQVDMLHVIDTTDFQNFLLAPGKMRDEKTKDAEMLFDKMAQEAGTSNIELGRIIKEGVIGEKIVETVEEDVNTNMLILGAAPGGSNNARKLINWLTSQLGQRLLTPILIIPGNLTDQQIKELS